MGDYTPKYCSLNDQEDFAKRAPKIYHALQTLQAYSPLGRRLYDWAQENDLAFQEEDLGHIMGLGGHMISCNSKNSVSMNVSILAHELMHAVQCKAFNLLERPRSMDARSYVLHGLGLEAGAVASQLRIMYEIKLSGHPEIWDGFMANQQMWKDQKGNDVRAFDKYQELGQHFEKQFKASVAKGEPTHTAMRDACSAAHKAYFKSQDLKDAYGSTYLKQYINDLVKGHLKGHTPFATLETQSIYDMSKICEGDHLIHRDEIELPLTNAALFGSNTSLQQAFDYVECVRIAQNFGTESLAYKQMQVQLSQDNNPYLGINLTDALKKMKLPADTRTPLEVMNAMAGIDAGKQMRIDFFKNANDNRGAGPHNSRIKGHTSYPSGKSS